MLKLIGVAGVFVVIVLILLFGPLFTVWALNTLFPALAIPYTFYTWLAVLVLGAALRTKVSTK
jgi:hypothetical protein